MMSCGYHSVNLISSPLSNPMISVALRFTIFSNKIFSKRNFSSMREWVETFNNTQWIIFSLN
tara:strand:- start:458 stop:643 length:186 start_codon:yes stop_codon:yes gene_type:complete